MRKWFKTRPLEVAAVLTGAFCASATDWPQWLGPDRDGHSTEAVHSAPWPQGGLPLLWETSVGTGFSSVVVAENRAFTMGNDDDADTVLCLDARSGRPLWQHRYACDLGPKYYEGGPGATPTVHEGQVFTISKWGDVYCLDAATGSVIWQRDLRQDPGLKPNEWGYAGSALVHGDQVFFNASEAGIALDRRTGKVLWFHGHGTAGYASPVLAEFDGVETLLVFAAKRLVGLDPDSGSKRWSFPWETGYDNNNADPMVLDGRVFITSYDRGCALLEVVGENLPRVSTFGTDPCPVYTSEALQTHMAQPVRAAGQLYGFSRHYARKPELRCIDFSTGRVRWVEEDVAAGSLLALADNRLLVLYGDGQLALIEATPDAYRELARTKVLEGRCWTPPALANGRLYVRNSRGSLKCLAIGP
ncbi:MAG: PQQ-binding-like beta-propeller repeat protein [Verrucomicrobiae bacterium]|nr:PQQ-binding-like beta-propeller repeat protein [Verrucomicrobiae bacterium]